jgi:hypothetical protein
MKEHGYEWGTTGRSAFIQDYGVLETITKLEPADNACSKAKTTSTVRRKPRGVTTVVRRIPDAVVRVCVYFPAIGDRNGDCATHSM